jgi:hypothetical protein
LIVKLKHKSLAAFSVTLLLTVGIGTFVYIYEIPPLIYGGWAQGLEKGIGEGPIPVNTLYTAPNLFNPNSTKSNRLVAGGDPGLLYSVAILDLSKGPLILSVPAMGGRYYDLEFVDSRGDDFAYVASRTTGGQAGTFLVSGPSWQGTMPAGVTQIKSPDNSVILFGRVLVQNASEVSVAYNLSIQMKLTPLSSWQPPAG